ALREAGENLLSIGDKIAVAGTAIGLITVLLIPIAVIFPVVAPAVPVFKGISLAITIATGVIKATGNTLITASEKAITDDQNFVKAAALETTLQVAESASSVVTNKLGLGVVGTAITDTLVGGTTGTIREANRAGVSLNSAEAKNIAGKEYLNAGISASIGAVFDVSVGKIASKITSASLTDNTLNAMLKSGKSKSDYDNLVDGVNGLNEKALGTAIDPVKSQVIDQLSVQDEQANPKASSQPGLTGAGSW
ncbi:MAG TPA: hypothetical protein PKM25_01635, partial [Candidatus Ozemobacteraceae bacterium]|nr:hypothetical protein [Candidatus Ozemobacteraceae bacterium]